MDYRLETNKRLHIPSTVGLKPVQCGFQRFSTSPRLNIAASNNTHIFPGNAVRTTRAFGKFAAREIGSEFTGEKRVQNRNALVKPKTRSVRPAIRTQPPCSCSHVRPSASLALSIETKQWTSVLRFHSAIRPLENNVSSPDSGSNPLPPPGNLIGPGPVAGRAAPSVRRRSAAERSFLRRMKNYMRSSMTEDWLNGSAALDIHKEIPIDIDKVINRFSRQKQRRMNIEDWSKD
ncbi:Hypothetical protein CINCED_3A010998 [Cinara cedri]|uniref:Uncharacterized protein n=1 Tax=Cinara cedri TaxID=506608 RepID=A0A5E4NPN0_9HEMI|nr:Hypothetical protein CINCED_3A010998 [Cinara cedri]